MRGRNLFLPSLRFWMKGGWPLPNMQKLIKKLKIFYKKMVVVKKFKINEMILNKIFIKSSSPHSKVQSN